MAGWHHCLNGHEFEQALEMLKDRDAWCAAVHQVSKSPKRLSEGTKSAKEFRIVILV